MSDTASGARWPAQCCVPAFLGAATAALAPAAVSIGDDGTRRQLAELTGVTLAPEDANPWALPTSEKSSAWGVSAAGAMAAFHGVHELLAPGSELRFEIRALNEIPFGLFEDAIIDLGGDGAVVGISFDYVELQSRMGRPEPLRRAHHVVRLTPLEQERAQEPNVLSLSFRFDYDGSLWVFDDSGELAEDDARMDWRALIYASRSVDGGLWIVSRG
jgi:hypothetical protein